MRTVETETKPIKEQKNILESIIRAAPTLLLLK